MKRYVKITIITVSVILLGLLGTFIYIYGSLEPGKYFANKKIPVLATPNMELEDEEKLDTDQNILKTSNHSNSTSGSSSFGQTKKSGFNVLLLGIDAREDELSRTDSIMLIHVEPKKNEISLISIPRDTRIKLPNIGYTKINHAHLLGELQGGNQSGTEASIQAVSNLCQCEINYYMKINFDGFIHFIDSIGGLDIELSEPVRLTYAQVTLPAGKNHLDGERALQFVQERRSFSEGDHSRRENQAHLVKTVIQKMLEPGNLFNIPTLYQQVKEDMLDTNLEDKDIASLARLAAKMTGDNMKYFSVPGKEGIAYDPLVKMDLYYWIPDLDEWRDMIDHNLLAQ